MSRHVANDEGSLSLADAEALLSEINRLTAQVASLEESIGELQELANSDPLVNLPNRRRFLADVQRMIGRVERYGASAAVLFVDVDGLKGINDKFGHSAGDEALVEIGQLLVASVRKSDSVARIGGDEFGIILEHSDELRAWQMALRVVETVVGSEFCVDGKCLQLSVAVGVGKIEPGDTPEAVLARADKEMYRVKAA